MSCPTGKRRYQDRLAAQFVLLKTKRSRSPRRRETRTYQCPRCHGWHLTSR